MTGTVQTPGTTTPRHLVFVYGSLLRGMINHWHLERHASTLVLRTTTCDPYTLVDLGGFPALVMDDPAACSVVHGEVYEVTDAGLAELDRLEGCVQGRKHNHYERVELLIDTPAASVHVWTYGMRVADFAGGLSRRSVVPAGNWRTWLAMRTLVVPR